MSAYRHTLIRYKRYAIIALHGNASVLAVTPFNAELYALHIVKQYRIILDVSGVEIFESAFLRAIKDARSLCSHHKGGIVVLCGGTPYIRSVLHQAGITDEIAHYPTREEAIATFN